MDKMNAYELIKKLLGPIEAVGDPYEDDKVLKNLEDYRDLLLRILEDLLVSGCTAERQEHSMRQVGEKARRILIDASSWIKNSYMSEHIQSR